MLTVILQKGKTSLNGATCWLWMAINFEDGILVTEQSVTWNNLLQSLIGRDRWLEKPNPINWLVMSSPSICLIKS